MYSKMSDPVFDNLANSTVEKVLSEISYGCGIVHEGLVKNCLEDNKHLGTSNNKNRNILKEALTEIFREYEITRYKAINDIPNYNEFIKELIELMGNRLYFLKNDNNPIAQVVDNKIIHVGDNQARYERCDAYAFNKESLKDKLKSLKFFKAASKEQIKDLWLKLKAHNHSGLEKNEIIESCDKITAYYKDDSSTSSRIIREEIENIKNKFSSDKYR
jgi:hypothetical protein